MEKRLLVVIAIMGIAFTILFLTEEAQIKELKSTIAKKDLEMKEKQNMINSYADKYLKECECECACDWLQSFYDEWHESAGAYE